LVLLNPALILALVTCFLLLNFWNPPIPAPDFDLESPVEVEGWVSESARFQGDTLSFTLTPTSVKQDGRTLRFPSRLPVYVTCSPETREQTDLPGYGTRIRFRSHLRLPSTYAVPGVIDPNRLRWAQGKLFNAFLKSPLMLEELPPDDHRATLIFEPVHRYLDRFSRDLEVRCGSRTAGFLEGALAGRSNTIPDQDWELMRRLGTVHLLVVSGFHIGLAAGLVYLLLRGSRWSNLAIPLAAWAFNNLIGLPPSATRACLAASLTCLGAALWLPTRPFNLLGIAALMILAGSAGAVFTPGFQLSFLSVAAILLARGWTSLVLAADQGMAAANHPHISVKRDANSVARRRFRYWIEARLAFQLDRRPGRLVILALRLGARLLLLLLLSTCIQWFLLPVTLYYSNLLSLISPLANLVLTPLFCLSATTGLAHLLLFTTPIAPVTAWIAERACSFFWSTAAFLDHPATVVYLFHPTPQACAVYLLIGALIILQVRKWSLPLFLALPSLLLLLDSVPSRSPQPELVLTFLDVGQGDALHIRYPDGTDAMVDTGGGRLESQNRFLAERVVARYLWTERTGDLAFVAVTHPEVDHAGTLPVLLGRFHSRALLHFEPLPDYGIPRQLVHRGMSFRLSGVQHQLLHPQFGERDQGDNHLSLVIQLRYGNFRGLLTGDLEAAGERGILGLIGPVDLLKVGHHGSRTSSTEEFLSRLAPKVAVISAGTRNPFGHPHPEVVQRLHSIACRTLVTAEHGSIRFVTDGDRWRLYRFHLDQGRFEQVAEGSCGPGSR